MVPDTSVLQHDPQWLGLIRVLGERKTLLIKDSQARFDAMVVYGGKVPREEVDALAKATMDMYVQLLSGLPLDPKLQQLPAETGRRRARQGVPADKLLEGVRTNSRVIWNALQQIASVETSPCLVRNMDALLSLVEWHVQEVQGSYLAEEDVLARRSERRKLRALSRIFDDPPPDGDVLVAVASELGLVPGGAMEVVVQCGPHEPNCAVCGRFASDVFSFEAYGGTCHFRPEGHGDLIDALQGLRVAVFSQVQGLAGVPRAAKGGMALLRADTGGQMGPLTVDAGWAALAWKALGDELAPELLPISLGRLRALTPASRSRLIETVSTYFATGSIKGTADRLYCHRNTVVKRLAVFQDLVGLDLAIPRQAAMAVLATSGPLRLEG
ncbi:helix-turn-helix domain-containing protein [Paenarthrobacter sp. NPDC090520]|uniref:PucR family transcriptional regulator n=1 Tax=unclassified Paenarthrobacter TaxID=2634190 RepID=UPI0038047B36